MRALGLRPGLDFESDSNDEVAATSDGSENGAGQPGLEVAQLLAKLEPLCEWVVTDPHHQPALEGLLSIEGCSREST